MGLLSYAYKAWKAGKKTAPTISSTKINVGNLKKNQDTMGKLIKTTDAYVTKAGSVDPGLKKALRDAGSKSLQKTDKILRKNKMNGGRIGRKLGGGTDMGNTAVKKKHKGFSKLPETVQIKINKKLAKKV